MSGASERANGQASGPVPTSRFLAFLVHRATSAAVQTKPLQSSAAMVASVPATSKAQAAPSHYSPASNLSDPPSETSGIPSHIFFLYMLPLLLKAMKQRIVVPDLWQLPYDFRAMNIAKYFRSNCGKNTPCSTNIRSANHEASSISSSSIPSNGSSSADSAIFFHSIHWILIKCYWRRILAGAFLRFSAMVFMLLQPVILGWFIAHVGQRPLAEQHPSKLHGQPNDATSSTPTSTPYNESATTTPTNGSGLGSHRSHPLTNADAHANAQAEWLWKGIFYAVLLTIANALQVISFQFYLWVSKWQGVLFQTAIIQVLYGNCVISLWHPSLLMIEEIIGCIDQ